MTESTIAIIGCGNMGRSLIGGLTAAGTPLRQLRAADPDPERRRQVREQFGIPAEADNAAVVAGADVVILAVKPQVMQMTLAALAPYLRQRRPLLLSIAAGIPTVAIARWAGADLPIVRAMPNTPALLGAGAAALFATTGVSTSQRRNAGQIMEALGIVTWLADEGDMDLVTALSGSGPAYFFLVMEALEKAATGLGLDAQRARELVTQTALGAARMAREGDADPATLRRQVTSPGGTTECALQVLQQGGLEDLFRQAVTAARDRAMAMARELGEI